MESITELRRREFDARQRARELRRTVYEDGNLDSADALAKAERDLEQISAQRFAAERKAGVGTGTVVAVPEQSNLLGPETTGLEIAVNLRMTSVPTSIVHLFESSTHPLVHFNVRNANPGIKRLRLISYVEGYSARSVETVEVEQNIPIPVDQLPTFFPDRLSTVTELTRATVNVEVEDLDAKTEVHRTVPVWLLARTTAPLKLQDPSNGTWIDMSQYLGAFVTPNSPAIMQYLKLAIDKHPRKRLVGYQVGPDEVASQVQAVYEALASSGIKYVNSIIEFTPDHGAANQRVRLPREALANTSANCVDGVVLIASLLEAISLNPAIVVVPGHAFLAWETGRNTNDWRYLETTMLSTGSFDEACSRGDAAALKWSAADNKDMFNRLSLRDLRAQGITPLE